MKVLMFGWEFPPHISGGLGTACYGLTKGLANHNVETIFVVPKAYGDEDQSAIRLVNASDIIVDSTEEIYQEFWKKITYLEIGSNLIPYVSPQEFARIAQESQFEGSSLEKKVTAAKFEFTGKYGTDLMAEVSRYALVAAGIAAKMDFDVIHAHDWLTYSAGITAKKMSGKPLVVHMHATEFDRSGVNINPNVYDIERRGMEEADRVITVSNLTRATVIEKYGINPDKVYTVHNAVEPTDKEVEEVKRHVKEKVVTFLGRLTFQKGPEYFIEAASIILQHDPNVRFVMAGSGDLMNKMIRRVAKLKIGTRFHFTGFLKGADVDKMFLLSDVFVMPSVSEPFGIVPLEAMRSNVPVVISKQSGVAEILKHALKVDFWDVHGLADSIYALLHYKSLRETFQKYGKDEVDSLKWDNAAYKVTQVYQTLFK
ncbi:MAG: glycosyltransferase family 4 protein [Bacteroidales bacterium]|jgi:glycogen(starch) synthase|nr:glycosyltransferase family 4 protein [Bacteroidota bacterium]OQC37064.1 MAG: Glycogen synthase [Bacteroidetes bacterium ADurb.Bin041]HNV49365.1 glycosyltransferase family 4 protein [Bacteroidales bacterium]HOF80597.1 glycosyltransferase family 4 protein [Bacteroidales bacterium]HOR75941.1 glycosyltransferase family 4 protein [Bacteroidales bacterium]